MAKDWREITVPPCMVDLPRSRHGFPIPYVATAHDGGEPDFRVLNVERQERCITARLCGICGKPLDYWAWFVGGELAQINGCFTDPAMHEACMCYSMAVCPFLSHGATGYSDLERRPPQMKPETFLRDDKGVMTEDRPVVMRAFKVNTWKLFHTERMGVFYAVLTAPIREVRFFAEGGEVTPEEAQALFAANPPSAERQRLIDEARAHQNEKAFRMRLLYDVMANRSPLRF